MLCSKCSEPIRPIVVFDIDGTLAEYHERIYNFVLAYFGMEPIYETYDWNGRGEMEDYLGVTKDQYREAKLAFRQGGQKRMMTPIPDGIKLWHHAISRWPGAEIWVATHRPWRRLDNIDPDTQWWLKHHHISYSKLIFSEDKYLDIFNQADSQRVVACFEDLGPMCDRAEQLDLPVRQVARPHNRDKGESRPHRGTLDQLTTWLDEQMVEWYEKTGAQNVQH